MLVAICVSCAYADLSEDSLNAFAKRVKARMQSVSNESVYAVRVMLYAIYELFWSLFVTISGIAAYTPMGIPCISSLLFRLCRS